MNIENILKKFKISNDINQIIFVIKDKLFFYCKINYEWRKEFETDCIYGKNGFSLDRKEGDGTTPIGIFRVLYAFGMEDKINSKLEYRQIKETSYFSCDSSKENEYNTWVESISKVKGEHLIEYPKQYHYGLVFNFNCNPKILGKGSAIFLHVKGDKNYTEGCVAIDEESMKKILKMIENGTYMVIEEIGC